MTSVWFILFTQLENARRDIDEISDRNIPEWVFSAIVGTSLIFMSFAAVRRARLNRRTPHRRVLKLTHSRPLVAGPNHLPTCDPSNQSNLIPGPCPARALELTLVPCPCCAGLAPGFYWGAHVPTHTRALDLFTNCNRFVRRHRDRLLHPVAHRQDVPRLVSAHQRHQRRRLGRRDPQGPERGAMMRSRAANRARAGSLNGNMCTGTCLCVSASASACLSRSSRGGGGGGGVAESLPLPFSRSVP
jgi:hypothetical protein